MKFTQDWFSHNISTFEMCMKVLDKKQDFLEVGCYEGRATCWMMQHGLDPDGQMTVIDTFKGGEEHELMGFDLSALRKQFEENANEAKAPDQILEIIQNDSVRGMSKLIAEGPHRSFDFIYIDGSHRAPDVLSDAVLAHKLLRKGGVMLFDDYVWRGVDGILHQPKIAIDSFYAIFSELSTMIITGHQVAFKKL